MSEHTQVANNLAREVRKRIRLGIVDFTQEGRMHVDCDCTDCSAILSQGTGDAYRVVSMVGRAFTVTE